MSTSYQTNSEFKQGGSKRAALQSLEEAVHLWFESCVTRGVLDKALAEVGFRKLESGWAGSDSIGTQTLGTDSDDYVEVSVPAYIAGPSISDLCATS